MQAEPRSVGLLRVLGRILCGAGCAAGAVFLLAFLAPGSDTVHAADAEHVVDPSDSAASALWADPGTVSAAATRRAGTDTPSSIESTPWRPTAPRSAPERVAGGPAVGIPSAHTSTPLGSFGGGSTTPDAGPSVTQLAVLSAALVGVRWLSQRLLASELSWRSALVVSGIERPG